MPTLSLIEKPAAIDAPRLIVSPGGYQWWYFEAYDPVADRRVTAILFDGSPFHPQYLRRYHRYRRWPTRFAPPVPAEFPGVFVAVYERDAVVHRAVRSEPVGAWRAEGARIRVGDSRFDQQADGAMRLTIPGSLDLTFKPTATPATEPAPRTLAVGVSVAEPHGWVLSNPSCSVSGEVTANGQRVRFDGKGYQDHNWGAEPVSLAARRWFWACAWLDDRAGVVAEVVPTVGTPRGLEIVGESTPGSAVWNGRTRWWRVPYPTVIDFGDALHLDDPRVVEDTPVLVQLRYRARVKGAATVAMAHVVQPGPVGWPVLGRVMERRIGTR